MPKAILNQSYRMYAMIIPTSSPSSLVSSSKYLICRQLKASQHQVHVNAQKNHLPSGSSSCNCCSWGRRHFLEAAAPYAFRPIGPCYASHSKDILKKGHPSRRDWYQELFAWLMKNGMSSYEAEIAGYKSKLFDKLVGKVEKVLEIGIGTGPNLKYYALDQNVCVFGVDPNGKMEKYACEMAAEVGLKPENFRFIQAVGEAIPLEDASIDAVVGTLVLCSVPNVAQTLNEIKRVLRPGGLYIFIEHVAAEDGTFLRLAQNLLDPLEQLLLDGCHLTRHTGEDISAAGFDGGVEISTAYLSSLPLISRHVYGVAYK